MTRLIAFTLVLGALLAAAPAQARDRSLSRTPPLGWNSWYAYRCHVTEQDVIANAKAMVDSGMRDAGYVYVNVDGCWEAGQRDLAGDLQADPVSFPSGMAALADTVHAMGLKFGLYTSAGQTICLHSQPGSYGNYDRDFRTFARWKVDYVKVDWCNPAPGQHLRSAYAAVARAAARSGRKMVVTVSTPGISKPWKWGQDYGNSWRVAPDLRGSWRDLLRVLDVMAPLHPWSGPSGWNDADILQVGNGRLTPDEERAHFTLWSILDSPLLAGNRLPDMTAATREILTNREIIALNQDPRGLQARRVRRRGGREVWVKRLRGRCNAVVALNRNGEQRVQPLDLRRLTGRPRTRRFATRDLWSHRPLHSGAPTALLVPAHGVRALKTCPR